MTPSAPQAITVLPARMPRPRALRASIAQVPPTSTPSAPSEHTVPLNQPSRLTAPTDRTGLETQITLMRPPGALSAEEVSTPRMTRRSASIARLAMSVWAQQALPDQRT